MIEIPPELILPAALAALSIVAIHALLSIVMLITLRASSKERTRIEREIYGNLRRIEGLTLSRREQLARHYDAMVESLLKRLPATIGSEAGSIILETEEKIIRRLTSLEEVAAQHEEARSQMDEVICSLEKLEDTVISATAHVVARVMNESRESFLREDYVPLVSARRAM